MPKGSQRQNLSLREKCEVLKKYDTLPSCSQRCAAIKLGITQPTLSRLLLNREKIKDIASNVHPNRKRKRDGKDVAVETALLQWLTSVRTQDAPISRRILMEKAAMFASKLGHETFKPTDGWLTRWKERNIVALTLGENNDPADVDGLDDELRTWIYMDEDASVVKCESEENIAAGASTSERAQAAEETEEIDGHKSTPPSAKEIHAALEILRRTLDIGGATSEEFRCFYRFENIVHSKISM